MSVLITEKTKTLLCDIRRELAVFFPATAFKLDSGQEDCHTVITVSYTDGVSRISVKSVVRQFAHCYYSDRKEVRVTIRVEREISEETKRLLLNEIRTVFKLKRLPRESDRFEAVNGTVGDYLRKIFDMRDF